MNAVKAAVAALARKQVGVKEREYYKTPYSDWAEELGGPPSGIDAAGNKVHWCTPAGTLILLADGTQVPVETVAVGAEVATAEGGTGVVLSVGNRVVDGVVRAKLFGHAAGVTASADHPLRTSAGYRAIADTQGALAQVWTNYVPPRPEPPLLPSAAPLPYTFATGRLIGLYLAEGHAAVGAEHYAPGSKGGRAVWSINEDRWDLVTEIRATVEQLFGYSAGIVDRRHLDSTYDVVVSHIAVARWFIAIAGRLSHGKFLSSSVCAGPPEFLRGVLEGWMDGDGTKLSRSRSGCSTSKRLIFDLAYICHRLGLFPSVRKRKDTAGKRPAWDLVVLDDPAATRSHNILGNVFKRVTAVIQDPRPTTVYSISVSGDQSYIADGVAVHNCASFVSWLWYIASEGKHRICDGEKLGKGEVFEGGCTWIPTIIAWAEKTGRWLDPGSDPEPGDLIVFQLPTTKHIGIVVGYDPNVDLDVSCVEGNWSSRVGKTAYSGEDDRILGFVRMP